jgi:hypothetical protein
MLEAHPEPVLALTLSPAGTPGIRHTLMKRPCWFPVVIVTPKASAPASRTGHGRRDGAFGGAG